MLNMKTSFFTLIICCLSITLLDAQKKKNAPLENTKTRYEGYFNFSYDESTDKIAMDVTRLEVEFMYVNSLVTGLGSNDIGLDRGQIGNQRVVKFVKAKW